MAILNEITEPEENGYFSNAYKNLSQAIDTKKMEDFNKLLTDQTRFQWLWSIPAAHEFSSTDFPEKLMGSGKKDSELASRFKEEGNHAFQKGDNATALRLYSKSIMYMPANPVENLAVVYANRSAGLYYLNEHLLALEDIEEALDIGYPRELRYKIIDRRAKCYLALKQFPAARESLRETILALDESKLPFERRQKWQMDVNILLAMMDKGKTVDNLSLPASTVLVAPEVDVLLNGPQKTYKRASASLNFEQDDRQGRHVVAGADIRPGDFLVIEPPSIAVLLQERTTSHCFQCFRRLRAPFACKRCSNVLFCGRKCRSVAENSHHSIECSQLPELWSSGASITCLMALRAVTQANQDMKVDQRLLSLVTHSAERRVQDFLARTHMAVFLARCLRNAGFDEERVIRAGGLILTLLQVLQFNAHEVSEMQLDVPKGYSTSTSVFLGGAIYPTLALFNHSCDPGVVRYFCGTSVVVRAVKSIKKGQPVNENYGPIYTTEPKNQRRQTLKNQYWFNCECTACSEDWPLFNDLDSSGAMRFRCDAGGDRLCSNVLAVPPDTLQFMVRCPSCDQHTNILKGLKALQDVDNMLRLAQAALAEGNIIDALARFIAILTLMEETLAPPFKDYVLCQQNIRTCMVALGNRVIKS